VLKGLMTLDEHRERRKSKVSACFCANLVLVGWQVKAVLVYYTAGGKSERSISGLRGSLEG